MLRYISSKGNKYARRIVQIRVSLYCSFLLTIDIFIVIYFQKTNDEHRRIPRLAINEIHNINGKSNIRNQCTASVSTTSNNVTHAQSDSNLLILSSSDNEVVNNNDDNKINPISQIKQIHSIFTAIE